MFDSILSFAANNPMGVGALLAIVFAFAAIYILAPRGFGDTVGFTGKGNDDFTYISTTDDNGVGSIRSNAAGTKFYKWVKYIQTASQAGVAGDIVCYKALTGYGLNAVSGDASADADAVPIGAGILVAAVTAAQGTAGVFLWIQIKGAATLSNAVTSAAAGKCFNASTTDKVGTVMADDFSFAMGVSVNTTTGVVLNCLF